MKFELRTLMLASLALVVAPVSAVLALGAWWQREHELEQLEELLSQEADGAAVSLRQTIEGFERLLVTLAASESLRGSDLDEASRFLAEIHQRFPEYGNLGLVDADGRFIASARPIPEAIESVADRSWFKRVAAERKFVVGDYQFGPILGRTVVKFGLPRVGRERRRERCDVLPQLSHDRGVSMKELRRILLADDNPNDVELTREALASHNLANSIDVVHDGAEALDYLNCRGAWRSRTTGPPAVVLLDIQMPKVDGLEVLRSVRADANLKTLPVVILTSSREEQDLMNGYSHGASSYVVKPVAFAEFLKAVEQLGLFWALINEPPPQRTA